MRGACRGELPEKNRRYITGHFQGSRPYSFIPHYSCNPYSLPPCFSLDRYACHLKTAFTVKIFRIGIVE
jgi:hypothetical protein